MNGSEVNGEVLRENDFSTRRVVYVEDHVPILPLPPY